MTFIICGMRCAMPDDGKESKILAQAKNQE